MTSPWGRPLLRRMRGTDRGAAPKGGTPVARTEGPKSDGTLLDKAGGRAGTGQGNGTWRQIWGAGQAARRSPRSCRRFGPHGIGGGRCSRPRAGCPAALAEEGPLPGPADVTQGQHATEADPSEDQEAARVTAGRLLQPAHKQVQREAAPAARRTDDSRHHADLPAEALRHQLEDRAVAHA